MKPTYHLFRALSVPMFLALAASAPANILYYDATLSGAAESPPNASPGTGFATFAYDNSAHKLTIALTFSGLMGTTTASHIHAPTVVPLTGTAGVATTTPYFTGFPIGVTAGTFNTTLDLTSMTSFNASYDGGTPASDEAALAAAMAGGEAYLNIHTTVVPGGEIRGFIVPEPSTAALIGLAGGAFWAMRRRKAA